MMAAVPYRQTFARLLTYLRPYKWTLWISVALAVLGALTGKVLQLLGFGVPADGDH